MQVQGRKLSFFKKLRLLFRAPGDKKLWLAALLAGLGYFISVFGLHRLYLGYHTEGLLQLGGEALGLVLVFAGVLATVGGASISPALILGIALLVGIALWQLIDFIRILIGDLQPKDGQYTDE